MNHKNKITIVEIIIILVFVIILKTEVVVSQTFASPESNTALAQAGSVGFGGAVKTLYKSINSQSTLAVASESIENQTVGKHDSSNLNKTVKYGYEILEEFNKTNKTFVRVIIYYESNVERVQFDDIASRKNYVRNLTHSLFDYIPSTKIKNIKSGLSNSFTAEITEEGFNELIKNEKVSEIYLDVIGHVALDDSVPLINADDVWNLGYTGDGVKVCIIDSGVNAAHPDLSGKIQDEYCYCSYTDLGNGGCCPDTTDEDDDAEDDLGHGTHVTGIIASQDSTYKGVAYDADIYVVKVVDSNRDFYFSDLGDAIDMCRLWDVDIISISLSDGVNHPGSSSCPTYIDTKINNAYNDGISLIVASGNNGYTTGIGYPACSSNVISVGASTNSDNMASFTNRGSNLDLLAPGQSIVSLRWDTDETLASCYGLGDDFMVCSGTSMAAPHVSGAAALLLEKDPSLTPDEIRETLEDTGISISGYPRINVLAAVNSIGAEGEEGQLSDCTEPSYDQCIAYEYGDCDVSIAINHYTNVNDIRWGAVDDDSDPYVIGEYTIGWKAVDAEQMYYNVDDPNGGDCYEGGCDGDEISDEDTMVTVYAPGTASREVVLGYEDTTSYYCWVFFTDFNPNYGENNPIYVLECYYDNDCSVNKYCDKSGDWDDWGCISKKSDGQSCTADNQCSSGYCDNDGEGLSDDNHCFTPYNTYFDGQETSYCEYSTSNGIADCDERHVGDDLNKCIGISYYEEECGSTCGYQDVTSIFECNETGCSCLEPLCDGLMTGSNITTCLYGQTYFGDKCNSTAGGEDSNICRSSVFNTNCTGAFFCNGHILGYENLTTDECCYGACLSLNCDDYDDATYFDNNITESEVTEATCLDSCSGNSCCSINTYTCDNNTADGFYNCQNKTIETTTYYCEYNGSFYIDLTPEKPTEVCDGIDNDCDGEVDEEFCISNITINSLTVIYLNDSRAIFEFVIENNGGLTLNSTNWSIDFGDGSTVINYYTFNLSASEEIFIFAEHNYTSTGRYAVVVNATSENLLASKDLNIDIGDLIISSLDYIHVNESVVVFEAIVNNLENFSITSINWSFNTGENTYYAASLFNFSANESISIIFENNYSFYSLKNYNFTVFTTNRTSSKIGSTDLRELNIIDFSKLYSNSTNAVFEFIINNLFSTNRTFSWSFDTNDTAGIIKSTNFTILTSYENISILFQHNFSNTGNYLVTARANTSKANYSESLDISLS